MGTDTRLRTWMVAGTDPDCTHPSDRLALVGEDGINVYVQCDRCEATFVARIPEILAPTSPNASSKS